MSAGGARLYRVIRAKPLSDEQAGDDAGQEDAIEGPGTADRDDRRADLAEVGEGSNRSAPMSVPIDPAT